MDGPDEGLFSRLLSNIGALETQLEALHGRLQAAQAANEAKHVRLAAARAERWTFVLAEAAAREHLAILHHALQKMRAAEDARKASLQDNASETELFRRFKAEMSSELLQGREMSALFSAKRAECADAVAAHETSLAPLRASLAAAHASLQCARSELEQACSRADDELESLCADAAERSGVLSAASAEEAALRNQLRLAVAANDAALSRQSALKQRLLAAASSTPALRELEIAERLASSKGMEAAALEGQLIVAQLTVANRQAAFQALIAERDHLVRMRA
jgi:chromosome segregation ATPase